MVLRSIIMRAAKQSFGERVGLPGISIKSLKHEISVVPLHFFTMGGVVVCTLFITVLMNYQDTQVIQKTQTDLPANAKLAIYNAAEVDWKTFDKPEKRPDLYK